MENIEAPMDIEIVNPNNKSLTKHSGIVLREDTIKYWDKEYINEVIEKIHDHKDRMLIFTLWRTGLRITEVLSITKQDIDFNKMMMKVKHLKSRRYLYRIVPIHPQLKDLLRVYTATMNLETRVFPITRQRADQIIKEYFGKEGYCHRLRHSFAVNWLRGGGDVVTLHRILGHARVQTTMEYLKIVPMDQGKELLKIDFG